MTGTDLLVLLPLIAPLAASVLVLLLVAWRRHARAALGLALLGTMGGLAALPLGAAHAPRLVTPLVTVDAWTLVYQGVVLLAGAAVAGMAHAWLAGGEEHPEELHVLVLLATGGACLLAGATHFASLFLGLELLSISLYALVGYVRSDPRGVEAAIKYLVLAATSSAFLLLGMAFVYGATGRMDLAGLAATRVVGSDAALVAAGAALVLVGIGFKLAVVPFHLWTPDVYQGAPAPVTALVATVSKGGVLAVLARWTLQTPLAEDGRWLLALGAIALASMLAGNLLALRQDNLKRLLAYSSIAHLGYALVALVAGGERAGEAVTFYVVAYVITSLAAFGTVAALSRSEAEAERLEDYRGLLWTHPVLASVFVVALLSLAGVPLTAGFLGKLFVLLAGVSGAAWVLVATLVLGSVIGLFYYLRVVAVLFAEPCESAPTRSPAAWVPLAVVAVLLVVLGVWPNGLLAWLEQAAAALS